MVDEYYIPDLSEFYLGFEYYFKSSNEQSPLYYSYEEFGKYETLEEFEDQILNGNILVKYLNKEDIESLGWEIDKYVSDTCITFKNKQGCFLAFHTNENYIEIAREDPYDIGASLFIKNKSELIKLMKQLRIK